MNNVAQLMSLWYIVLDDKGIASTIELKKRCLNIADINLEWPNGMLYMVFFFT